MDFPNNIFEKLKKKQTSLLCVHTLGVFPSAAVRRAMLLSDPDFHVTSAAEAVPIVTSQAEHCAPPQGLFTSVTAVVSTAGGSDIWSLRKRALMLRNRGMPVIAAGWAGQATRVPIFMHLSWDQTKHERENIFFF